MRRSYDVIVVGAGFGGLYAIERLRRQGLSVLAIESGSGVGGVWFHNRYPGARVDVESIHYRYHFSRELTEDWRWTERFAAQDELLRYLNHVTDRFDLRKHIHFDTTVIQARWRPEKGRYDVETNTGESLDCRFLMLATGQLSAARKPDFAGLDSFEGEWVQTSHWADRDIKLDGKRVVVIGTGSSGVQSITAIAEHAAQLYVFQRSPNYSVPAGNAPLDRETFDAANAIPNHREALLATRAGINVALPGDILNYADYTEAERADRLERQWKAGGQGINMVFADQNLDADVNAVVVDFVKKKVRGIVRDPGTAELLTAYDHPIGTRRVVIDTGYYEVFNQPNVELVNVRADPIARITPKGIELRSGAHYDVDVIVFALGFHAFRGAMERIDIRNEHGRHLTQAWDRGPRTLLGLMTAGFPNLFFPTGPGSPSVLANMALMNEQHIDFTADLIAYMDKHGYRTVEADRAAEEAWTEEVARVAQGGLRMSVDNYMVQVNKDGTRVFMPYIGGLNQFNAICKDVAADSFRGFAFQAGG